MNTKLKKEELSSLLYKREQEIKELNEMLKVENDLKWAQIDRAKAEGYQEAIREIIQLVKEIAAMGAKIYIPTEGRES